MFAPVSSDAWWPSIRPVPRPMLRAALAHRQGVTANYLFHGVPGDFSFV